MRLPSDWDKPSPENKELCRLFKAGIISTGNARLPYRYFAPDNSSKLPLVYYFHGADCFGNDNESQLEMHDAGTLLARTDWQLHHPCHIIAPQCKPKDSWGSLAILDALERLHESYISGHNIDKDRVYAYGYSAGGIGLLRMLKKDKNPFAAAIPICGATERDRLDALKHTPIWLVHAVDDTIVPASYKNLHSQGLTILGSKDLYERLKDDPGYDLHYEELPEGYMKSVYNANPHCSWVHLSHCPHIWDWLFKQKREH